MSRFAPPFVAQAIERIQIAKYHTLGGHGFAAEDVNTLIDRLTAKKAEVVGVSNQLHGADRLVDGVLIQSKYYASPSQTVRAAFGPEGAFLYEGQVLEVPRDQFSECVELMAERIADGQVPNVSNPAEAEKLVRQGAVTYEQAKNVARAGTVESLIFDAGTQCVSCVSVFSVAAAVTFAQQRWSGKSSKEAAKAAVGSASASGLSTLIIGVLSAQILRTKVAAAATVTVRGLLKATVSGPGPGREIVECVAKASLGKAVHGAAAVNHVAKLLRTNAVTGVIALGVTSAPDFYRRLLHRRSRGGSSSRTQQ